MSEILWYSYKGILRGIANDIDVQMAIEKLPILNHNHIRPMS